MIQRVQTLYLIAVLVIVGLLFNFTIASFQTAGNTVTYRLIPESKSIDIPLDQITDVNQVSEAEIFLEQSTFVNSIWAIIANTVLGILVIVTIFLYKNRSLQLKVNAFSFLVNLALLGILFWQTDIMATKLKTNPNYETAGILLPLLTIILLFLVNKAIRKDDRMIKAADRLR